MGFLRILWSFWWDRRWWLSPMGSFKNALMSFPTWMGFLRILWGFFMGSSRRVEGLAEIWSPVGSFKDDLTTSSTLMGFLRILLGFLIQIEGILECWGIIFKDSLGILPKICEIVDDHPKSMTFPWDLKGSFGIFHGFIWDSWGFHGICQIFTMIS